MENRSLRARVMEAVLPDEALAIVRTLIQTRSDLASEERERPVALYLKRLFESEGIDVELQEAQPGRPNVIATLKGTGQGPSLMLNGHTDTVPPFGMDGAFDATVRDGILHGRGAVDMKAGVGTMAYALIVLKRLGVRLKGDLVFAGVIDEESSHSEGTHHIVKHGPVTDFAIVGEPTNLVPIAAHKGIEYFEVTFEGRAAHSSNPDNGINALYGAADFLLRLERELAPRYRTIRHPLVGHPTVNADLAEGYARVNYPFLRGEANGLAATVAEYCRVVLDIRWTPSQTLEEVVRDVQALSQAVAADRPGLQVTANHYPWPHPAMEISAESPLAQAVLRAAADVTGRSRPLTGVSYWADSGLLYGLGKVPCMIFGPGDISYAHAIHEQIEVAQIAPAAAVYALTALDLCGVETE